MILIQFKKLKISQPDFKFIKNYFDAAFKFKDLNNF